MRKKFIPVVTPNIKVLRAYDLVQVRMARPSFAVDKPGWSSCKEDNILENLDSDSSPEID